MIECARVEQASHWALSTADVAAVPAHLLDDGKLIAKQLDGVLAGFFGTFSWRMHRFAPRGVSLVGTAVEGRVIVHTWPERGALTMDVYGTASIVEKAAVAGVEALTAAWPVAPP